MKEQLINWLKFGRCIFVVLVYSVSYAEQPGFRISGVIPSDSSEVVRLRVYPTYCFQRIETYDALSMVDTTHNGRFSFRLPTIVSTAYIQLKFSTSKNRTYNLDKFLVEPGDDVTLQVTAEGLVFSGKGAAKYECQYSLNQITPVITETHRKRILALGGQLQALDTIRAAVSAELADSVTRTQLRLLSTYRSVLSNTCYAQLYTDYLFGRAARTATAINDLARGFTADARTKAALYRLVKKMGIPKLSDAIVMDSQLLLRSRSFADFAVQVLFSCAEGRLNGGSAFDRMWELLTVYFPDGPVYGHLLTASVLRYYTAAIPREYRDRLLETELVDSTHQRLINKVIVAKSLGQPAFPFVLTDVNGDTVRLSEFSDQVVIMDFWFTGCSWCQRLEKNLKPIKVAFADDDRVAFLSINLDKDREQWLSSVSGGEYTDSSDVNLFTSGQRFSHPLPSFYGFQAAPQLLIFGRNHQLAWDSPKFDYAWLVQYIKGLTTRASPWNL